ncbi:hypothetical protein cyc_03659 [Cyclospora cayetanensis]|uniref:Toxoplasma gondii family D protein n=1 Tax=Cyclospora cayetanensis TaxID=88456 RepID=A0A1D3D0M2_9EIME|nr:hypothetical protein cyc_03659 [Cyclospora cayetanensis]
MRNVAAPVIVLLASLAGGAVDAQSKKHARSSAPAPAVPEFKPASSAGGGSFNKGAVVPPPVEVPRPLLVEEECFEVPFSVEKTCYRDEVVSRPSSCPAPTSHEFCTVSQQDAEGRCFRLIEKEVQFECPKASQQKLCARVPKTVKKSCSIQVEEKFATTCPKQIAVPKCEIVAKPVEGTCIDYESYKQEYECWGSETTMECTVEMNVTAHKCNREVKSPEEYAYEEVVNERHCNKRSAIDQGKCVRSILTEEQYPCNEQKWEKRCSDVKKVVQEPCEKEVKGVESYDCSEIKVQQVPKTCTRRVPRKALVERCGDFKKKGRLLAGKKSKCKMVEVDTEEIETYPCTEDVHISVPKVCTREISRTQHLMCPREVPDIQCDMELIDIPKNCIRQVTKEEEVPCSAVHHFNECEDVPRKVPRKGYRFGVRQETFDCPRHEFFEKCHEIKKPRRSTCVATLFRHVEKPCEHHEFEELCHDEEQTVDTPCIDSRLIDIDYPCPEQIEEEHCVNVPAYEMGTCTTVIQESEEYPCPKREPKIRCKDVRGERSATCFKPETTRVPYTCYEVDFKEQCVQLATTEAPPAPVKPAKKEHEHNHLHKPPIFSSGSAMRRQPQLLAFMIADELDHISSTGSPILLQPLYSGFVHRSARCADAVENCCCSYPPQAKMDDNIHIGDGLWYFSIPVRAIVYGVVLHFRASAKIPTGSSLVPSFRSLKHSSVAAEGAQVICWGCPSSRQQRAYWPSLPDWAHTTSATKTEELVAASELEAAKRASRVPAWLSTCFDAFLSLVSSVLGVARGAIFAVVAATSAGAVAKNGNTLKTSVDVFPVD